MKPLSATCPQPKRAHSSRGAGGPAVLTCHNQAPSSTTDTLTPSRETRVAADQQSTPLCPAPGEGEHGSGHNEPHSRTLGRGLPAPLSWGTSPGHLPDLSRGIPSPREPPHSPTRAPAHLQEPLPPQSPFPQGISLLPPAPNRRPFLLGNLPAHPRPHRTEDPLLSRGLSLPRNPRFPRGCPLRLHLQARRTAYHPADATTVRRAYPVGEVLHDKPRHGGDRKRAATKKPKKNPKPTQPPQRQAPPRSTASTPARGRRHLPAGSRG